MPALPGPHLLLAHLLTRVVRGMPGNRFAHDSCFLALRPELVLQVDGDRPILYPVEGDVTVHFLRPVEALVLSLFDGRRTYRSVRDMFLTLFPDAGEPDFEACLRSVDDLARVLSAGAGRAGRAPRGTGAAGAFERSRAPMPDAVRYDPFEFVIDARRDRRGPAEVGAGERLRTPVSMRCTSDRHRPLAPCPGCPDRGTAGMPLVRWEEIFDEMVDLGIRVASPGRGISPSGRDGARFLEMLLERRFYFRLSVTTRLGPAHVERLLHAGLADRVRGRLRRPVEVRVDATDETDPARLPTVSRIRARRNAQTFASFMRFGIVPRVTAVVTGPTADQLLPVVGAYHDLGARSFMFRRYGGAFGHPELLVRAEQLREVERQLALIARRYPDVEVIEDLTPPAPSLPPSLAGHRGGAGDGAGRGGCGAAWSGLGIAPGGDAFLDGPAGGRSGPRLLVGDARTQSLREIWDGATRLVPAGGRVGVPAATAAGTGGAGGGELRPDRRHAL